MRQTRRAEFGLITAESVPVLVSSNVDVDSLITKKGVYPNEQMTGELKFAGSYARFVASIEMVGGVPKVTWLPEFGAERVYRVMGGDRTGKPCGCFL